MFYRTFTCCASLLVVGACATTYLPGTRIVDTPEHRELLDLLERYRQALEAKDAATIVGLASPRYFEDLGTPETGDDYGYEQLAQHVLKDSFAHADQIFVTLTIDRLEAAGERAEVDVRFEYRAHLRFPAGDKWINDTEFNRFELAREDGRWKFLRGL